MFASFAAHARLNAETHRRYHVRGREVALREYDTPDEHVRDKQRLDHERDERLSENELMSAFCQAVLSSGDSGLGDSARYQIVRYHCETCARGQQVGGGAKFDLEPWEVELGECDAERVGRWMHLRVPSKTSRPRCAGSSSYAMADVAGFQDADRRAISRQSWRKLRRNSSATSERSRAPRSIKQTPTWARIHPSSCSFAPRFRGARRRLALDVDGAATRCGVRVPTSPAPN